MAADNSDNLIKRLIEAEDKCLTNNKIYIEKKKKRMMNFKEKQ